MGGVWMRNRRGQLAGLLFPLAALVLVGVSLFTFVSFNGKFSEDSEGRDNMLSSIAFYENYIIKDSGIIGRDVILSRELPMTDVELKGKFQEFAVKRDFGIVDIENYFDKIERGEFEFKHSGNGYLFEIKNLDLRVERGANSFSRNLSFQIIFDFDGKVLS